MTLNGLREIELSLMRATFESACLIAGLPLQSHDDAHDSAYVRIAATVQTLVECGVDDLDIIARRAAESSAV